jgi:hypothetical protein
MTQEADSKLVAREETKYKTFRSWEFSSSEFTKKQIEQPETVARAERDREIHEDQNEQHGESWNQSSHYREQEAKPNPTSNRKSKWKIELPHTPASTEHESRKRVGLQIWRRW